MHNDIERVLIEEKLIKEKIKELAVKLNKKYKNLNPLMICVLNGSIPFFTDLIRDMDIPLEIDCISISSYGKTTMSGEVKLLKDINKSIQGRHVIIVEDIIDTGRTLNFLKNIFAQRQPASLEICTLLDKPALRMVDLKADYSLFEIDDVFVVGYGLDYAEKYRNLPYVGELKKEVYSK